MNYHQPQIARSARPGGEFHGLAIELKAEGINVWLKDGTLTKNAHVQEQYKVLQRLAKRGYAAYFASGFAEAREVIDSYLGSRDQRPLETF